MEEYTIDAKDKKLGRVATEAASVLRGKNRADFVQSSIPEINVYIINVSEMDIGIDKLKSKVYTNYTGYPGGLKKRTAEEVVEKKGYAELMRKAVYGMLPPNKLRKRMMKNLFVSE